MHQNAKHKIKTLLRYNLNRVRCPTNKKLAVTFTVELLPRNRTNTGGWKEREVR
jgi:hypothetical protein